VLRPPVPLPVDILSLCLGGFLLIGANGPNGFWAISTQGPPCTISCVKQNINKQLDDCMPRTENSIGYMLTWLAASLVLGSSLFVAARMDLAPVP
jgi:hypothetical protein